MKIFETTKISQRITAIRLPSCEFVYLVEGDTSAALIDTSSGYLDLHHHLETLTDKPIFALLTHGHSDHIMGTYEFGNIYMNQADDPLLAREMTEETRHNFLTFTGAYDAGVTDDDLGPIRPFHYTPLMDGDRFDLGNLHIIAYKAQGHTPGSMAFLVKEERTLLLGDACTQYTFMIDENSLSITDYLHSMETLKARTEGLCDTYLVGHVEAVMPPTIIDEVIEVCKDILIGNTDDVPIQFGDKTFYYAKAIDDRDYRADGRYGNIIYDKDKLI